MKLYKCMHDIKMMCHEKRKITLAFLGFELSALDLVPYSKQCPGHNSLTVWNILMKLYRCVETLRRCVVKKEDNYNSCLIGF